MTGATVLASAFERPAKFDLAAHWARATAELEDRRRRFSVVLALAPSAAQTLAGRCSTSPAPNPKDAEALPSEWVTLRAEFDDQEFAKFVVLGLGTRVRALEPPEFRMKIETEISEMARNRSGRRRKETLATT